MKRTITKKSPKKASGKKFNMKQTCPYCNCTYMITCKEEEKIFKQHTELCKEMQKIKSRLGF